MLYDQDGNIKRSWLSTYGTLYSKENHVEQDPEDWWKAVCSSTRNVLRGINEKDIAVVSFSGQMMGCLPLDNTGTPLRKAIIWADMRSYHESEALHDDIDEKQFYKITGHRISSAYTLSKLLWIRNNEPEVYSKTAKILQSKDYIVYRLTDRIVTDYSDATGMNMYNLSKRSWSRTILSITGINESILPEVTGSTEIAGEVSMEAAAETGLLPGTPVVIGAGDGVCATVAGGCTDDNDAYMYFGSSAWIGLSRRDPILDPAMRTFNWAHITPNLVVPCGTMQAAGATMDWMREELARTETEQAGLQHCGVQELIDFEISDSPPGANGLIFLPHLLGERSPYWDPLARGALVGLKRRHRRSDVFRAHLEGVVLNLKVIWNAFDAHLKPKELVLLGGLAASDVSCQLIADAFGIPTVVHNHLADSKNFGAAFIGGMGIGMYNNPGEVKEMIRYEKRFEPADRNAEFYDSLLPVYEEAYQALRNVNMKLDQVYENQT